MDQAEAPGPVSPKVLPIPSNIPNKEPFAIGADDAIPEGFHQDLTASTTDVSDIEGEFIIVIHIKTEYGEVIGKIWSLT